MNINATFKISYQGKTPAQMKAEWEKFINRELPVIIGREAVNFFKDRFRYGNWIDAGVKMWQKRSDFDLSNVKGNRALLVQTGKLRNSIRVVEQGSNYVVIGSDMPYAQVHNEGFKGTVSVSAHRRKDKFNNKFKAKAGKEGKKSTKISWEIKASGVQFVQTHTRQMNMPQRQFMGASEFLFKRINMIVQQRLKEIFG